MKQGQLLRAPAVGHDDHIAHLDQSKLQTDFRLQRGSKRAAHVVLERLLLDEGREARRPVDDVNVETRTPFQSQPAPVDDGLQQPAEAHLQREGTIPAPPVRSDVRARVVVGSVI